MSVAVVVVAEVRAVDGLLNDEGKQDILSAQYGL